MTVLMAGCGGGQAEQESLGKACRTTSDAVARIGPVVRLGDAGPALRTVIALERSALVAVVGVAGEDDPLAARLRGAISAAERTLASVERQDPLRSRTMSPLRTTVPAARRAVVEARALVDELCRRSASSTSS